MTLRPYQQRCVDASIDFMRASADPFLIEAATGAGKSHVIAEVAHRIHAQTGKRVLCLAPSAELVMQNRAKYLATGNPCSMFSASAGAKDLRHPVVFGSPLTVKNRISRFKMSGDSGYALVVVDECHGITPTVRGIIAEMRVGNPYLRVMGLTATPYRLGSGYIFAMWPDGRINGESAARDPYFVKCVDRVTAPELIGQGYLTPPRVGAVEVEGYDTSGLVTNARGQFDAEAVDRAYHGQGRRTSAIVADVVAHARHRKGVMFFAATVQHAREIMDSLPPALSRVVTAETPKAERASVLARFKARELKYLVNVSVLTTGFDAPHVDVIALLRRTESVGLLQQIIGRGLRLDDGKTDCLVLDYTENITTHCPDGDLFAPIIRATKIGGGVSDMPAECEDCGYENTFIPRPEAEGFDVDANGYILDLQGFRVETDHGPMPAHFGRRCVGLIRRGPLGNYSRCEYRWTSKPCPECDEPNDIAARYCCKCKTEIVDPNRNLLEGFTKYKKDPSKLQTDRVVSMEMRPGVSAKGNKTMRIDLVTEWRSFSAWLMPEATFSRAMKEWKAFCDATNAQDGIFDQPETVTYRKDTESGFYRVYGWNQPADEAPEERAKHAAE